MKRFTGYISLCVSLLGAALVGVVPTILGINGNGDYSSSKNYVFKISNKRTTNDFSNGTENGKLFESDDETATAMDYVLNNVKSKLSTVNISEYKLETIGNDSFQLTFKDNANDYDDVVSYLTFSNSLALGTYEGSFQMGYQVTDLEGNNGSLDDNTFFKPGSAKVEYRNNYPYVVLQLSKPETFKEKITELNESTSSSSSANSFLNGVKKAEGATTGEEEESKKVDPKKALFVLNNWLTGFNVKTMLDGENGNITDANLSNYILTYWDTSDQSKLFWDYDSSLSEDEQKSKTYEYVYFQYYNLGAANGETSLDVKTSNSIYNSLESDSKLAYKKATLLCNKLNSSYLLHYDINVINKSQISNSTNVVDPFLEYLKRAGSVQISTLLISFIIAIVIVSLFVFVNYGVSGFIGAVVTLGNVISSLALFNVLGNEFNLGTIIGLIAVASLTLIGVMYWLTKAKNELYSGKNAKKAYQEASRKSNFNVLDFSVIGAIIGLTCYLIPNAYTASFGSILIFGSILNLIFNGIIFRGVIWFLYNSNYVGNNLKLLSVDTKMIPNLSMDEKPKYFESFKKKASKKSYRITSIIGAALLLASICGITTFQVINGNIYNQTSTVNTTMVTVKYNVKNASSDYDLETYSAKINNSLDNIYKDSEQKTKYFKSNSVNYFYYEYVSGDTNPITNREYYFIIDLGNVYDYKNDKGYLKIDDAQIEQKSLEEVITTTIQKAVGTDYQVTLNNAINVADDSNNMYVAIAMAISVACIFTYLLLRFGLSKSVVALLIGSSILTVVVGIFSLIRGPFTSEVTLGLMLISLITYLVFDIFFLDERNLYKDNKKDLANLDTREERYEYENNLSYVFVTSALMFVAFMVISCFFTTSFDKNTLVFMLCGLLLIAIFVKGTFLPFEMSITKLLNGIKNKERNNSSNERKQKHSKEDDTGEPEEAIFVGIND